MQISSQWFHGSDDVAGNNVRLGRSSRDWIERDERPFYTIKTDDGVVLSSFG